MLNIRLQGGNTVPSTPEQEPSAAGTLRLMTAQHNASLNPVSPRTPQELLAIQQRRAMSTVPNGVVNQAPVTPTPTPQVQGGQVKGQFSPGRVSQALQRSQFYGHNPNLKLPPDLFLLGCIFVIVEYDVSVPHLVEDWKTIIAKHGGEVEPCYCARVTHVLCETQKHGVVMQALRDVKRCVTADWLSDIIMKKQVTPPWLALHLPSYGSKDQKPAYKHILSLSGFEYEERELVRRMIEQSGAKFTGSLSRLNTGVICRRPDTVKARAARDWGVPCLNVQWLSELLVGNNLALHQVDIPKYQAFNLGNTLFKVDYGIVPHLLAAWKSPINITQESHERVKRGLVPPTNSTRAKKPRLEAPPPHILLENVQITCINPPAPEDAPKVLFSQVNSDLPALEVIVKQLGGQVVTDFQEATHLVIGKVQRTPKLLYCLITSDYIVTPAWLMESKQNNTFLPCDKYIAKNEDFEKCFNCDISKVISTKNRRELFKDKIFYITHGVQPSRQFLTDLIELSGGVVEKRRRTIVNIHEQNSLKTNSYIILTCKSDLYFITDVLKSTKTLKVVCNTEVVMSAIMRQELILEPYLVSLET